MVPDTFTKSVAVLLAISVSSAVAAPLSIKINAARLKAAGIRRLPVAEHLILYTDLPSSPEIDALPELFDQAFPQWCKYFHVNAARHADWQTTGFLMKDKEAFRKAGLLPGSLQDFAHGFSQDNYFWLYNKRSDYYRRHLLLHEGTHSFMRAMLGGCGPPWYAEGMAEMLATHRLEDGQLTLNYMPASQSEVPSWGRIRIIQDAFAKSEGLRLRDVIEFSPTAHKEVGAYAWSWAAVVMFDRHPRYQERFRTLRKYLGESDFDGQFTKLFSPDFQVMADDWAAFIAGMEYGYDFSQTAIDYKPGVALPADGRSVRVAADRGWQSSRIRLVAGTTYHLTASGRYQIGTKPSIWWSEPGGVSLRYYQGRPLGMLLAVVLPDKPGKNDLSALLRPIAVGADAMISPEKTGTLYLRINHSAAELRENAGELTVQVKAEGAKEPVAGGSAE